MNLIIFGPLKRPHAGGEKRLRRFIADVRFLFSRHNAKSFRRWYDQPCERCGGKRDYRVWGHYQVVCWRCASPVERITRERLERTAAARRN